MFIATTANQIDMAEKNPAKFPTFDCVISNTVEDYDSEMERFFLTRGNLSIALARLRNDDGQWAKHYEKMMSYLSGLVDSLIEQKDAPSHEFLIELSLGEELEDDTTQRLLRSNNPLVADTTEAALLVRDLMFWFVRNGKEQKLSKSFTPERFQGLPFLRLALVYRSVSLSKN